MNDNYLFTTLSNYLNSLYNFIQLSVTFQCDENSMPLKGLR